MSLVKDTMNNFKNNAETLERLIKLNVSGWKVINTEHGDMISFSISRAGVSFCIIMADNPIGGIRIVAAEIFSDSPNKIFTVDNANLVMTIFESLVDNTPRRAPQREPIPNCGFSLN